MGMAVGASTSGAPQAASAWGATGGSPAERAYRQAVKQMAQAQQQLAKHAMEHADEDTMKMDQQAVDMAAAALSQAMTAMAKEAQDAADAQRAKTPVVDGPAPSEKAPAAGDVSESPSRDAQTEETRAAKSQEPRPVPLGATPDAVDEYV